MERKFIAAVAALIFWAAAPVNAGNIIKSARISISAKSRKWTMPLPIQFKPSKAKSFFRGAPGTLMIAPFFMLLIF